MKFAFAVAAAVLLAVHGTARAASIVDTGASPTTNEGYLLLPFQELAGRFKLEGNTQVTALRGWLGSYGTGQTVTVSIYSDAGHLPSKSLFSSDFTFAGSGWQGLGELNWSLGAGNYWAVFSMRDWPAPFHEIWMPTQTPNPLGAYAIGAAGSFVSPPASEPPINFGLQIEGTSTPSGVPEPASWAMLIGGFGLAGSAIRTRRRPLAALA